MKRIYKLLFILAFFTVTVNLAQAQEVKTYTFNYVDLASFSLSSEKLAVGAKYRAFNDSFVFQLESKTLKSEAILELKRIELLDEGTVVLPAGYTLDSQIYEFNLKSLAGEKLSQPIWFSIKYNDNSYYRKNMFYYDDTKKEWIILPSIINKGASKLISNFSLTYAKVAVLENAKTMSEGVASWYKYKGCNCAASPDYPKGTKLKVTNIANNKSVVVKVNDWGPERDKFPDRVIDLDVVAFKQIAAKSSGLCRVKVEPLTVSESTVK